LFNTQTFVIFGKQRTSLLAHFCPLTNLLTLAKNNKIVPSIDSIPNSTKKFKSNKNWALLLLLRCVVCQSKQKCLRLHRIVSKLPVFVFVCPEKCRLAITIIIISIITARFSNKFAFAPVLV